MAIFSHFINCANVQISKRKFGKLELLEEIKSESGKENLRN
jgi:hypothetical protein